MAELDDELFLVEVPDASGGRSDRTLSFSRSPTVLLTFAANRFTRKAARHYQETYGIGAMDWRMLVMLTREPGASVTRASETIGIDKAAVSRCLARLEAKGLATAEADDANQRRRNWTLTEAGRALHAEILEVALRRQRILLEGLDEDDVRRLSASLRIMLSNIESL